MPPLSALISLLFIIPLIAFWVWMLRDMLNNDRLPNLLASGTLLGDARTDWMVAFIFLNVFAAALYYSLVYRNRR